MPTIADIAKTIIPRFSKLKIEAEKEALYKTILEEYGKADDVFKARGGDLTHDIGGAAMDSSIYVGTKKEERTMIKYIESKSASSATSVRTYMKKLSQVMVDFDKWGRNKPRNIERTSAALKELTSELTGLGFSIIVLDAQFGNLFKDGFGTQERGLSMRIYDGAVSQLDGATKAASDLALNGVQRDPKYEPFEVPCFYGPTCTTHTITTDGTTNSIAAVTPDGNFSLSCKSGISVNAICKLTKLPAPRGSGNAGKAVVLGGKPAPKFANLGNHIVFIKTITDWAQIVYVFYLNYVKGIKTVLITNDEYCLALAATLCLPFVIRTPSTASKIVELYTFDPTVYVVKPGELVRVRNARRTGIPEAEKTRILAELGGIRDRMNAGLAASKTPDSVRAIIQEKLTEHITAISSVLDTLAPIPLRSKSDAEIDAEIETYRFLIRVTPLQYIEELINQGLQRIYNDFVAFGVHVETNRKILNRGIYIPEEDWNEAVQAIIDVTSDVVGSTVVLDVFGNIYLGRSQSDNPWKPKMTAVLKKKGYPGFEFKTDEWNTQVSLKGALAPLKEKYDSELFRTAEAEPEAEPEAEEGGLCTDWGLCPRRKGSGWWFWGGGIQSGGGYRYYMSLPAEKELTKALEDYSKPSGGGSKPSCSEELSSLIASFNTTDSFDAHMTKFMSAIEAMQMDAYESNVGTEYLLKRTDIEDKIQEVKDGSLSPAGFALYIAYTTLVHPDMASIIPTVLNPTTELPAFVAAVLRIKEFDAKRNTAAGVPEAYKVAQAARFAARKEIETISPPSAPSTGIVPVPSGYGPRAFKLAPSAAPEPGVIYNESTVGTSVRRGGARRTRKHKKKRTRKATRAARRRRSIRRRQ